MPTRSGLPGAWLMLATRSSRSGGGSRSVITMMDSHGRCTSVHPQEGAALEACPASPGQAQAMSQPLEMSPPPPPPLKVLPLGWLHAGCGARCVRWPSHSRSHWHWEVDSVGVPQTRKPPPTLWPTRSLPGQPFTLSLIPGSMAEKFTTSLKQRLPGPLARCVSVDT